ncbi:putative transcriptional regulator, HxlR family protein [Microbispora rosea subsp. aerata]|nr:helix-turn-helix domain-containing protein [Microbispora rosea]GGO08517.1 putative transcriptional regulator, HxlR family protein [Microbispora rosea subsp. aerata]GIH55391.1 putative transcriptional regulator, HxlR family protein [Microbispora rosea subsp. aerata]GLJ84588.1 putative transcriptional regulator, HxlR family protein [Microbispora rosea subsp. aerata]
MQSTDVRECSIARTLDLVGERWTLLALRELFLGNHRFEAIVRHTGAPRDILTTRLRKLEAHGLIARSLYQERPRRYEYRLTPLGESLAPVLTVLREWGDEHLAGPDGPPATFTHSCGAKLEAHVTCRHCGEEVKASAVRQAAP